jgi:hypothetical protein
MKDVQRPWMFKALCGTLPRQGRLLEVGAGEPLVADLLAALGHEVWVIDPYDGRAGGPADVEAIQRAYPRVNIVQGVFPRDVGDDKIGSFDAIYSISVLEHIPIAEVDGLCDGIRRFLTSNGATIHAIDHVLKGKGDAEHLDRLQRIVTNLGISAAELGEVLARAAEDVETYFLSAEGHNLWRGSLPYDQFPMRRCISVQLRIANDN